MIYNYFLSTSESVTAGHPDKIADQISDAIIDEYYKIDVDSKANLETMVTKGLVIVAGKVTTKGYCDIHNTVRNVVRDLGYTQDGYGFSCDTFNVFNSIEEVCADFVFEDLIGHNDQTTVCGYACMDTPELMPLPIVLANKLACRLDEVRRQKILPYLMPDGKVMVTVQYTGRKPSHVEAVTFLTQHQPQTDLDILHKDIIEKVIKEVVQEQYLDEKTKYYINANGSFIIGGPSDKVGMSGRRIAADTYGGVNRNNGVPFSGKDPHHIDRWGSYNARYIAKNIVAAGLAECCEIQITYAKGKTDPVCLEIETFGTEKIYINYINKLVKEYFHFQYLKVMEDLDLRKPIYKKTASYGHFGREDNDFAWEKTDKIDVLREYFERNKFCRPSVPEDGNNGTGKKIPSGRPWPEKKSYIKKYNIPIDITVEGRKVEGVIIECTWRLLIVKITNPFQNLTKSSDLNMISMMASGCRGNLDNDGNLTNGGIRTAEYLLRELYYQGQKIQHIKGNLIVDRAYRERTREYLNYTRTIIERLEAILYHNLKEYSKEEKGYIYSLMEMICIMTFFFTTFPEVCIPDHIGEEIIKLIDGI